MKYINLYEIAQFIHFTNLDATTFKKFKRRLSAELELNDDEIIINNVSFQKNEIYEILDNIDRDKSLLDIYKSLYENKELNNFLNGQLNITDIKKLKNILFLEDRKTIDFITPYLIDIFSKIYKEAFLKNDINILEIEPPLDKSYYEKIYEPIYNILKNKENELINLKDDYYDFDDIQSIIGDIKTINALPDYFIKIKSDIAQAIRNLSIDSWNENEDLDLALKLINYALKFDVNSKTKDKFLSDKDDLERIKLQKDELPIELLKELKVEGIEGLTSKTLEIELKNGATFRKFKYCISFIIVTYTKVSPVVFIKSDENYFTKGLPYALKTLLLGWWGIPYGPIYSIGYLLSYIFGGENLTKDIKKIINEVK